MLKTKIQEKFETIWSNFVEEVTFFLLNFPATRSHVKEKKVIIIKDNFKSKIKNNFLRILETKIQQRFVRGVAFCNFGSHKVQC